VQRSDLPTFFARIWGSKQIKVAASATAEAYNPTNTSGKAVNSNPPVAPICVKPWLLPNLDPNPGGTTIFDPVSGAITNPGLLGWTTPNPPSGLRVRNVALAPVAWRYYPGNPASFPPPTQALPTCATPLTTPYQQSVAGCVQVPIACNNNTTIQIDNSTAYTPFLRNSETADAVNCLTHAANGAGTGDTVTPQALPTVPFEFIAGRDNPIPGASGNDVMVSNSLVTVPVYDVGSGALAAPPSPPGTVTIVGFVQLFLNDNGSNTATNGGNTGRVPTTIVNLVGCGTGSAGIQPILGNGASPVAVRLIAP
jgi:hypothetical protein